MTAAFSALGNALAILVFAYVIGLLAFGVFWAVISRALENRPQLGAFLGEWRILRAVGAFSNSLFPGRTDQLLERAHDRTVGWRERFGWKRALRRALTFIAVGLLVLAGVRSWGAYKRSTQWYAIEPPPDVSGGLNIHAPLRPDADAWIGDWSVKGVFWSKAACVAGVRKEIDKAHQRGDGTASFVSAQRCVPARTPGITDPDSESDVAEPDSE